MKAASENFRWDRRPIPLGLGRWRWLGLGFGVALFLGLLLNSDLSALLSLLAKFQWRFLIVLAFYLVIFGLDTYGWSFALRPAAQRRIPWSFLFRARLAGEAVNYITPSAWIGGEPVKVALLARRHGIPWLHGVTSVVVAKTTFAMSMLLFVLLGLGVALATQPVSASLLRWVGFALPALALLLGLFLLAQFLKPFGWAARALARWWPAGAERIGKRLKRWDEAVASFYRRSPRAVLFSLAFHFLGWLAGAVEVFLILWLLGVPVSLATAVSIEALWVLLKSVAFLIPAAVGASEGIALLLCISFGIGSVPGLALGLIRRARELAWVGLGLADLGWGWSWASAGGWGR
jgi:putative membrane protein